MVNIQDKQKNCPS